MKNEDKFFLRKRIIDMLDKKYLEENIIKSIEPLGFKKSTIKKYIKALR